MTRVARPLFAELERFRARALMVTFVRYAIVLSGGVVIALATALLLIETAQAALGLLLGVGIALALVIAGTAAIILRPGLQQTATLVDRRCRLDDCVTAAVQFANESDPVSQLIVQQAQTRLNETRPADAFPFEWGGTSRALPAVAVLALLVIAGNGLRLPVRWWSGIGVPGSETSSPLSPGDPGAGRIGSLRSADGRSSRTAAAPVDGSLTAREPDGAREPSQAGTNTPSRSADRPAPSSRADAAPQAASNVDVTGRSQQGNGSTFGARRAGEADSAGTSAAAPRGGSGAGSGPGTPPGGRAGGVSAGRLTGPDASGAPGDQPPADYALRYREALALTEQALAREPIPAELRDAVRAYFTAIRP